MLVFDFDGVAASLAAIPAWYLVFSRHPPSPQAVSDVAAPEREAPHPEFKLSLYRYRDSNIFAGFRRLFDCVGLRHFQ